MKSETPVTFSTLLHARDPLPGAPASRAVLAWEPLSGWALCSVARPCAGERLGEGLTAGSPFCTPSSGLAVVGGGSTSFAWALPPAGAPGSAPGRRRGAGLGLLSSLSVVWQGVWTCTKGQLHPSSPEQGGPRFAAHAGIAELLHRIPVLPLLQRCTGAQDGTAAGPGRAGPAQVSLHPQAGSQTPCKVR